VNRPSLEWLTSPIAREDFFGRYWEKQTLVVRRDQPGYFAPLLSFDDIDRVIATPDRRYPDICLKNASRSVTADDYTLSGGALDVARLYQLFQEGSTVTLAYLDTVIPALTLFCRGLEEEFSCPFQTNIYMTPPRAQGAAPHYDTHDVFVLQVAGSKRWTIFGTPVESPLPNQDFDPERHELGAPTLEFELQAGDTAYIPRGVAHEARSTDTVSLHITTGILRYTWADLLLECVAAAGLKDPAFRKALPPGFARSDFDRTAARGMSGRLLREAAHESNFDAALDYFVDKFMRSCPPVLEGQMNQLAALDSLSLDSLVGARPGVISRLESGADSEVIHCYNRTIAFPAHAREAVRFALENNSFTVRDLPGRLDDPGKLTLIRRLIREGLVQAHGIQK
jgi:ribosomal protein L16 Arg81 hydroxylase